MRKIKNPYLGHEGYNCFGCSPSNPLGLHMEFYEDGDDIVSFWHPHGNYQGWVGVMHGGILSTLIDEVAGWVVARKLQTAGMTTRMDVRYKHPVMADDSRLTIRARLTGQKRNHVFIDAVVENSKGEVCVEGTLTYYAFDRERALGMGFAHCDVEEERP